MAFYTKSGDRTESIKQRLNLSILANEVIQYDMFAFGATSKDGFINRIFSSYYPKADASIALCLNSMKSELNGMLSDILKDDKKRKIIDRLIDKERERLIAKANVDEKSTGFNINLQKDNFTYLSDFNSGCEEDEYYDNRRGRYIKAVLEEYARLHYVQRELIYFQPFADEIQQAIERERRLRIVTERDGIYSVCPFGIRCDPLSTANYPVGYAKQYDDFEGKELPYSFRISALKLLKCERRIKAPLSEEQRIQLQKLLDTRGVQFLSGTEDTIIVRLTEEGKRKYHRQIHLRPKQVKPDKNVKLGEDGLMFRCTMAQAEFYFFKFGPDVEIIQPQCLRERFKSLYKEALESYTNQ